MSSRRELLKTRVRGSRLEFLDKGRVVGWVKKGKNGFMVWVRSKGKFKRAGYFLHEDQASMAILSILERRFDES